MNPENKSLLEGGLLDIILRINTCRGMEESRIGCREKWGCNSGMTGLLLITQGALKMRWPFKVTIIMERARGLLHLY